MGNINSLNISFKEKLGYALGDVGGVLTFSLLSSFQQMFYTDVLHIPLAQITVLMIVSRIWDAVNDPMWGAFIDSRKPTKHGKFRPYILWCSIPMAFVAVLMFTKIPGLTTNQYLVFAYITYIAYGMLYTGVNIPYGSLASVITSDAVERSSLSMWRSIGSGLGGLPATIILPLLVYTTVEGTGEKILDSNKFTFAVAILSAISVVVYIIHFKFTKENIVIPVKKQEKYNVFNTIKMLLKNKPFMVLCLISMLLITCQMYTQTTYNYLLKNYYGKPGLYSVVTICTYLPMAIFIPFLAKLVRRFGKKEICAVGIGFSAIVNILMYLLKFTPLVSNPYVFLVLVFFSGAGLTFLVLEIWALVTDVIDYHEYLSHRREEGTAYAFVSFARNLGHTLSGAGSSAILGFIGYNVNSIDIGQSADVVAKLYDIATLVPAIVLIIMFFLLTFAYKLSKKRLDTLQEELLEMRNAEV